MKSISFVGIFVAICAVQAADDASIKKVAKSKTEEINKALINENFGKVADLTYPKLVQLMGGRTKMISAMESGNRDMKSKGFAFVSAKVDSPSDPVMAGSELFIVVPYLLEMKVPGGKLRQKAFVIGVSSDKGKSWTFVNGDLGAEKVKLVVPSLPDRLKLPEKQEPVVEMD